MIDRSLQTNNHSSISGSTDTVRLLFVVEGLNDIEFLRRISLILHGADDRLPNIAEMQQRGELIFVPFGGGHVRAWSRAPRAAGPSRVPSVRPRATAGNRAANRSGRNGQSTPKM